MQGTPSETSEKKDWRKKSMPIEGKKKFQGSEVFQIARPSVEKFGQAWTRHQEIVDSPWQHG